MCSHAGKLLFSHIVNDVKRVNQNKQGGTKLNNTLQNFMFTMLKDENQMAAVKSLSVMVELWRRKLWTDAKTVNAIATVCFSPDTKMITMGLRFFLGVDWYEDEEAEQKEINKSMACKDLIRKNANMNIIPDKNKNKRKRAAAREKKKVGTLCFSLSLSRVCATAAFLPFVIVTTHATYLHTQLSSSQISKIDRQQHGGDESSDPSKGKASAIHLLYDPQTFAERLFGQLKSGGHPFETRLLMMNVISRLIGAHQLMVLNFYPFLQKYMQPHQRHVTQLLSYLAQVQKAVFVWVHGCLLCQGALSSPALVACA